MFMITGFLSLPDLIRFFFFTVSPHNIVLFDNLNRIRFNSFYLFFKSSIEPINLNCFCPSIFFKSNKILPDPQWRTGHRSSGMLLFLGHVLKKVQISIGTFTWSPFVFFSYRDCVDCNCTQCSILLGLAYRLIKQSTDVFHKSRTTIGTFTWSPFFFFFVKVKCKDFSVGLPAFLDYC